MSGWTNGPLVSAPTTSGTLTGLSQGTSYDLRVVAVNAAGPGGVSNVITRTTLASFVPSPAGTTIPPAGTITGDDGSLWTVVGGVIWRDPPGAAANAALAETNSVTLLLKHTNGVIYQQNSLGDWWYYDPTQGQPWIATSDPRAAPPPITTGGPGTGPAFQNLTSYQDMGNGQKASTGMTTVANNIQGNGFAQIAVKPYEYNGFWRGPALGNFLSPVTAVFVSQGNYLYTPDVASIFSATGCPSVNPGINPIAGIRGHVRYFTAGNSIGPVSWGLYFEPGMTTDGHGDLYAVFTDFSGPRGDTFHCSGAAGQSDSLVGLGVFRSTSWGSIYDLTGVSSGVPGYGLGWVAFVGYNMTANQMIADW